jgi:phosphohistidine phosphatase
MSKDDDFPGRKTLYGSVDLERVDQNNPRRALGSDVMLVASVLVLGIFASLCSSIFQVYPDKIDSSVLKLFQTWPTNLSSGQTRTLILLRHAKSSWEFPGLEDFDRPLNAKGEMTAKRLGKLLFEKNFTAPDVILSSPSVRTRQTLNMVRRSGWADHVNVVWDPNLFDLALTGYLDYVKNIDDHYNTVMIIGHNPAIEDLAHSLVGVQKVERLPPGAFCVLQFQTDDWSSIHHANLVAYIDPSKLIL